MAPMDDAERIYLDHNATTPVDPRVVEAMLPYFSEVFGNAASRQHDFGKQAAAAVEHAREQAASLIGAEARDVVFTSGATEAINLALKGVARWYGSDGDGDGRRRRHIVTSSVEHKAGLDACARLEEEGFEITYLQPNRSGVVDPAHIEEAIREDTCLVSIMWANNEVGAISSIPAIGAICKQKHVIFHSDATQYVGKAAVDVEAAGVDLLSWSAHKMYGPKGVGGLFVRRKRPRVRLIPQIDGGGHERGLRSGTVNVSGVVGFGAACEVSARVMEEEAVRLRELRDRLEAGVIERLAGTGVQTKINGGKGARLPGTTNISFAGVEAERLIKALPNVAVSSGSACTTLSLHASYVLRRMGLGDERARSSVRFGLGRTTTEAQIDTVLDRLVWALEHIDEEAPICEPGW
ncbi:MAG: cysteine desulfurase family protein [Planctomycetota bacterium]|jgi:cysteine desulfurase